MEDVRQFVFGPLPGERPGVVPSGKCLCESSQCVCTMYSTVQCACTWPAAVDAVVRADAST